jgi:hypothetical protein
MSQVLYTAVVKSVSSAVSSDTTTTGKWQNAGHDVAGFFTTQDALEAVKAQFIVDAILTGMDKRYSAALAVDLPRKGSKEYNELSDVNKAKWDTANQAKKDARAISHTYFARVVSYAWPKEKAPSEVLPIKDKFNLLLSDLVKKCEKAESAPFDIVQVKATLEIALAIVNK